MEEVDDLDTQFGMKTPEPAPPDSLGPTHTEKYTLVMIIEFSIQEGHICYPDVGLGKDFTHNDAKKGKNSMNPVHTRSSLLTVFCKRTEK